MSAPLLPCVSVFACLPSQNPKHLSVPPKILRRWDRNRVPGRYTIPTSTRQELEDTTDSSIAELERRWDQILYSSSIPSAETLTEIFDTLAKRGHFHRVSGILSRLGNSRPAFTAAMSTFAEWGQARAMEEAIASWGLPLDSAAANARLRCYAVRAALPEMEAAYASLRRCGFCIDAPAIRAAASAYLRRKRVHELGEFARAVGLTRPDTGPLTWNLLLLSYAAGFRMKTLQREFLRMVGSGVAPDLTTFNLRALAFSRMSMMWDLHLTIEHMRRDRIPPDLVTYGCVVDAYAEGRLVANLGFALRALDHATAGPAVGTDPLVFEAMGKGDFHSSCEAFLEFSNPTSWTYRKLLHVYQKKLRRRDNIFWNY